MTEAARLFANYAEARAPVEAVSARVRGILGERLAGLYLFGSLTTGDFEEGISDVDLLAALSSELTDDEFLALDKMHRALARELPAWNDRIEVLYLTTEALRTFSDRRSPIAVISPGEPFHYREGGAGADWLMNWYHVRKSGLRLFGPHAADLIHPISKEEFVEAVREHAGRILAWLDDGSSDSQPEQAYAIVTACRAWMTVATGSHVSKREAAAWAGERLPDQAELIGQALECRGNIALARRAGHRHGEVNCGMKLDDTLQFVRKVAGLVDKI